MTKRNTARLLVYGALALAMTVCWLYAQLIERTWLDVTETTVPCPTFTDGAELRFAVLADLHARPGDGAYLDEIVRRTLATRPDAVLLLGDYLNGHETGQGMNAEELAARLRPLADAGLPLFAVLGNHDYYHDTASVRRMLAALGARIVEGRAGGPLRFEKNGAAVDIGGIRCLYHHRTPGPVPQPQGEVPLILLSHTPAGAEHAAPGTFLTVCGHTHGGQVCWPGGRPLKMADGKTPIRYSAGMLDICGQRAYVTRGLGTSLLPIRFFCRPELCVIVVKGSITVGANNTTVTKHPSGR